MAVAPLYKHKFVTVDPSQILPTKKKDNLMDKSRNDFYNEASEQMNRASDRFIKIVIEPQKKIISDELYNHDEPAVFIEKTFNRLEEFNNRVTDVRANIGDVFDKFKAEESVKEARRRGINASNTNSGRIDDFFEYDMLKEKGFIKETRNTYSKYTDVDSLLWDDDQPTNKKQSKIKESKPVEQEDSYDIDPSLFDD